LVVKGCQRKGKVVRVTGGSTGGGRGQEGVRSPQQSGGGNAQGWGAIKVENQKFNTVKKIRGWFGAGTGALDDKVDTVK